ncbi:hypothetical protein DIC82_15355 [Clostridium beijerinckii]|nr:hypothetical protein DIC82_15355 [Clostridium beijerinckii]
MDFTLALPLICIFAADILFFITIKNNKLDFKGKNQYRFVTPVVVLVYIISIYMEKRFDFENILIVIGLAIFALLGNKCGVSKKGIITGSWFTAWRKIDEVSVENQGEKCILLYSNKNIRKRLIFKKEEENELKKYIENIKRENNIKK